MEIKINKTYEFTHKSDDISVIVQIDDNGCLYVWDTYQRKYMNHIPNEVLVMVGELIKAYKEGK